MFSVIVIYIGLSILQLSLINLNEFGLFDLTGTFVFARKLYSLIPVDTVNESSIYPFTSGRRTLGGILHNTYLITPFVYF